MNHMTRRQLLEQRRKLGGSNREDHSQSQRSCTSMQYWWQSIREKWLLRSCLKYTVAGREALVSREALEVMLDAMRCEEGLHRSC
jgi:hypothetical protein